MQLARGRCVRAACVAALIVSAPPLAAQHISINFGEAFDRASGPLRGFMEKNVREKDLRLFVDMSGEAQPQKPDDCPCASSSPPS
jgi:flagellar biosynthesis protein FliP